MAEEDNSQEKTEQATTRRLDKAREEGQIPRSRELTTSAILLGGTAGLMVFGGYIGKRMEDITRYNLLLERDAVFDVNAMLIHLGSSFTDALWFLVPLFIILIIASIVGPIALGGWLFSTKAMAPKLSRMNPQQGLKRMFGVHGLVELAKALAKVLVILALALWLLNVMERDIINLAYQDVRSGILYSLELSGWAALALAASTLLIAAADIPFQIWEHARKLKMSRQEVRDEMKDTEGKPEVKGRIRQLQRELANSRMMAEVPQADVVITNPTHFSVALKYDPESMSTPVLLAKGGDLVALKIREVAKAHKVEIVEAPMLARAIFHTTELGSEIPSALYVAVAQVLAYVFQLREYHKNGAQRPIKPRYVEVPPEMRFNS